jgi:NAD-dependent DNA ligase
MTEKNKTGHRQRLRDRFLSGDDRSRSDQGLLELLLTFAIGRKNVQPLAEDLVRAFGTLEKVLAASNGDLQKIKGLGQTSIALLKVVDFIKNRKALTETTQLPTSGRGASQMQLFQDPPLASAQETSPENSVTSVPPQIETQPVPVSGDKRQNPSEHDKAEQDSKAKSTVQTSTTLSSKKSIRPKLQVSNSYLLEFDQLSRVLDFSFRTERVKKNQTKIAKRQYRVG